tara:strand:+ start:608 stop:859 length:252 start_codon:yes stop_codon:yes gene_type:complete
MRVAICNFIRGVVSVKKRVTIEIEIEMSGNEFIEYDTGTHTIDDVEIESAHMFGRDWSEIELRAEFGALASWVTATDNGEDWE